MVELELNIPQQTIVPAIEPWFGTGFLLKENCTHRLEVTPPTQTWTDGKLLGDFTADGKKLPWLSVLYLFIRMPSVKWYALLGCINRKRKTYFKIGILKEHYTPPEDGELICFANDALGFYKHNNKGEMILTVTRIK